ncbi:MAG: hypothetical protein J6M43_02535, partial [Neisseriaceae bacterium]|nr:hypothetical protein [Neisseriaceae bacterium]
MNKIYRTVYNETTGTWVAVCETAKTHTKSSGSVVDNATESVSGSLKAYSLTAVTAAAALLSPLMANQAQAADVLCKNDLTGVVSAKAACDTGESLVESLAVGSNAQVNSNHSFAFGNGATVNANSMDSVALGSNSKVGPGANNAFAAVGGQAQKNNSISIGVRSIADGEGAIAFGSGITVGNNAGSYAKGEGSIAIGKRAEAVGAIVTYEGAAGELALPQDVTTDQHGHQYTYNRDVENYQGYAAQMVAIGDNASAYGNQSIAIGGNSVASGYASISIGGDDIGNDHENTTIVNYLRNDLKQELEQGGFTTPKAITNLSEDQYYVNLTTSKGVASTAFGIKAVSEGDLSNAYGVAARSVGLNSNAIGTTAFAGGDESIAFGTASKTAMNTADHATAIGYMSQVDGSKSVALGYKNKVTGNSSTAVGQNNTITGNNSGAFGDPNNISGNNSYAAGNNNTIATDNTFVLGNNVTNTLENSVYLGKGSTTATTEGGAGKEGVVDKANVNGITYSGFAGKEAQGIVSVGSDSQARRIQNVAAGAINATSTDAINGSQLYAVLPKYLKDDGQGGLVEAVNGDTPTAVTIGNTTYQLAQGGSGGSTTVVGTGSIKVDPTTTGASQYTVSIPVVANSGGNAATAASVADNSTGSVAVGENAKIGNNVADSIAIGKEASVGNLGTGNVVIGAGSSTPNRAKNMVVIGTGLNITQGTSNAVVIGSGSAASSTADSDLIPNTFTFRSTSLNQANEGGVNDGANTTVATFNVGAEQGQLRQIKGVAAGRTEKGSTDAVNGDQLYTVALAVDNMGYSLAGGGTVDAQGNITGGTGVLGESFTVNTDDAYGKIGTIIGKNIAGTGEDTIEDAIKATKTIVEKESGSPITVTSTVNADKSTTYTVGIETTTPKTVITDPTDSNVGKVVITSGDENKIVTADDLATAINSSGWVASDSSNNAFVATGDTVTIQGKNGVKVGLDAKTQTFTVSGLTVSGSTPATGTSGNATATELTDADGNVYNIGGADGNTVTDLTVNGGNPAGNTTGNLKLTKDETNPDNPIYDVSLNNVVTVGDTSNTSNDKPVTIDGTKGEINFTNNEGKITNVASHLQDPASKDDKGQVINPDNAPANFDSVKNEAATVGDVLNAGWNLKVGGQNADFVQHGDTVAFGNGKGTTAQFAKDATTGETTISFDIAKAGNSVVNTTVTNPNSGKVT